MEDSFTFLTGKGCLVEVKPDSNTTSLYSIEGLQNGTLKDDELLLIDSIDISSEDAALAKDALNDTHALYVYGTTFSKVIVKGTIYMGSASKKASKNTTSGEPFSSAMVKSLTEWFSTNRLSQKKGAVNVSMAQGFKGKVYFLKLRFGDTNPKINAVGFALEGIMEPKKDLVNGEPAGTV